MEVRVYAHGTDHDDVLDHWFSLRGLNKDMLLDLPTIGFIVYNEDNPVAAGFIRDVEGNFGLIDSYITNPEEKKEIRHQALDLLSSRIIESAKLMGFKRLLCMSIDANTLERSMTHGFKKLPYSVMGVDIS